MAQQKAPADGLQPPLTLAVRCIETMTYEAEAEFDIPVVQKEVEELAAEMGTIERR